MEQLACKSIKNRELGHDYSPERKYVVGFQPL